MIQKPLVNINLSDYHLSGVPVTNQKRVLKDLHGFFEDETAFNYMNKQETIYEVQAWLPVSEGTVGGLFFGKTVIKPGKVGNEYFMTKGHFHKASDRAEFYWGIQGEGVLILMDRHGAIKAESMKPGTLHYIPGDTAHRVANTGTTDLIFAACWPSDAGHDYEEIAKNGFTARLIERDGKPFLQKLD